MTADQTSTHRIWLVTAGEPLPIDPGEPRLMRTGLLAQYCRLAGHEVVRFASSLNHATKTQRVAADTKVEIDSGSWLWMLHAPPYDRNLSVGRWRNHHALRQAFRRVALTETPPNIIVASMPTIELAHEAVQYAVTSSIPVLVDVRDMWPDIAIYVAPRALRPIVSILTKSLDRLADETCARATGLTGHTEQFLEWGLRRADRQAGPNDAAFPFGYEAPRASESAEAGQYWDELGLSASKGLTIAAYAGAISHQLDAEPVLRAAERLREHDDIKFVFCGVGDRLETLRNQTRDLPNVIWTGWVDGARLRELLRRSVLGLACLKSRPDYLASIPNKVPEYLSAALPITTNLQSGPVHQLILETGCGFAYRDGDALARGVLDIRADAETVIQMRKAAKFVYEERFRADRVYPAMVSHIERVIAARQATFRA